MLSNVAFNFNLRPFMMVLESDVKPALTAAAGVGISFAILIIGMLIGVGLMWARKLQRRRMKWGR